MKKTIKIVLFFVFCIILFTTCVKAESNDYKITLSADKQTVKPGEEVTITILMENLAVSKGIAAFMSAIEISEDVFDIVEKMSTQEIKMLYNGTDDPDLIDSSNPWGLIMAEDGENKMLYAQSLKEIAVKQGESQIIGRIKLKVKENATPTTTMFNLSTKIAFDNIESLEETTSPEDGYLIEDSEQDGIQIQIQSLTGTQVPNDDDTDAGDTIDDIVKPESKEDDYQENEEKKNKAQTEDKATQDVPYAGIEDWIPFIFLGITISIITYINYRKYKDI